MTDCPFRSIKTVRGIYFEASGEIQRRGARTSDAVFGVASAASIAARDDKHHSQSYILRYGGTCMPVGAYIALGNNTHFLPAKK